MRFSRFISGLAVAMAFVAGTASATPVPNMVITFTEQNGDVNAAYTGSVDTTGFSLIGNRSSPVSVIGPSIAAFASIKGTFAFYDSSFHSTLVPFGTGGSTATTNAVAGSLFGFQPNGGTPAPRDTLLLPVGYSGGTLSGSALWSSKTFLSLGLTPGTYYQPIGNNTFQINVTPSSPVPEIDPAGMGSVLALVAGALGVLERRRQKVA